MTETRPFYVKYKIYSLNVSRGKVGDAKKLIMEKYGVAEDEIVVKDNRFGNFAIFYKRKEEVK